MWAKAARSEVWHNVAYAKARGTWHTSLCGMFMDPAGLELAEDPKGMRCIECLDVVDLPEIDHADDN
jgi:hypothetical protein